jgi:hypothetical protein
MQESILVRSWPKSEQNMYNRRSAWYRGRDSLRIGPGRWTHRYFRLKLVVSEFISLQGAPEMVNRPLLAVGVALVGSLSAVSIARADSVDDDFVAKLKAIGIYDHPTHTRSAPVISSA